MQRRNQRDHQGKPSKPEADELPELYATPKSRAAPKTTDAKEIKARGEGEREHYRQIGGPVPSPGRRSNFMRARRDAHRNQQDSHDEHHRSHPVRKKPAAVCVRMISANNTLAKKPRIASQCRGSPACEGRLSGVSRNGLSTANDISAPRPATAARTTPMISNAEPCPAQNHCVRA